MTLRDDLLPDVAAIRTIPEALGLRRVIVALRSQTSTSAFNTSGTITNADTPISPRPRVVPARERPGFSGAAIGPAYDGKAARRRFTIGPMTREYAAGGLSVSDLFPVTPTASARPLVVLSDESTDGELGTTPVVFTVEAVRVMQFSLYLDVIEADTLT